jgi:hypothetical protein
MVAEIPGEVKTAMTDSAAETADTLVVGSIKAVFRPGFDSRHLHTQQMLR